LNTYEVNASQLRVIDRYYSYLEPEKWVKPIVHWYYGATGTGKSYNLTRTQAIGIWFDQVYGNISGTEIILVTLITTYFISAYGRR
jgi:hypothetical protein